ncbi:MAG TPA: hypothetical protein VKA94_02380 [Hyphomicrobiales bacterium]|nr:hypothetical protein [Hyphomicrobiales bacterium]
MLQEWRDSIRPEDRFTGWSALGTTAKRIENYQQRFPNGENAARHVGERVRHYARGFGYAHWPRESSLSQWSRQSSPRPVRPGSRTTIAICSVAADSPYEISSNRASKIIKCVSGP